MKVKQQSAKHNELAEDFKKELQITVRHKLDEISHYVSGCDSPFTYHQIGMVQEFLLRIAQELGIDIDESYFTGGEE